MAGATVYVSGIFAPPAGFGGVTLTNTVGTSSGFVAALVDNVALANAAPAAVAPATVYPHPARTAATVRLPEGAGERLVRVNLTDALGRTVRTCSVSVPAPGLTYAVNVADLPAGMYLLQVQMGSGTMVHRLTVE